MRKCISCDGTGILVSAPTPENDVECPSCEGYGDAKPKIFVFSSSPTGGEGPCYALAEDGTCLGSHWCSNEGWAKFDLGVEPGTRPDRHKDYAEHYPDGYEMEFIPAKNWEEHEAFSIAFKKNLEKANDS